MKHTGYCRCPDGTDIKPFEFFNTSRGFQEFWVKVCQMKKTHNLEEVVVGFESTGSYEEYQSIRVSKEQSFDTVTL
ncbi:MAG: hypothetical protein HY752_01540 [Nitrospirae bacterium]|nr:hypothetical protein [Nitrospirota bacterium]